MQRLPQRLLPVLVAVAALALPGVANAGSPVFTHGNTMYVNDPQITLEWAPSGTETDFEVDGDDCAGMLPLQPGLGSATSQPETLAAPGVYCFQVLADDGGTPVSSPVLTVYYDTDAPAAPAPALDASTVLHGGATADPIALDWAAADDGLAPNASGVDTYEITRDDHDGNGPQPVATVHATTWSDPDATTQGERSYLVTAVDRAGNSTAAAGTVDVTFDSVAPTLSIDSAPSDPSPFYEAIPFAVSSDDPDATLECSIGLGVGDDCSNGDYLWPTVLQNGPQTFTLDGRDVVGNVSTTQTYSWTIDSGTTGVVLAGPSGPTSQPSATFRFSWAHPDATFRCELDGSGLSACSSGQSYPALADGSHTFQLEATDPAGSVSTQSRTFDVDTVAPAGTLDAPAGPQHGVLPLSAHGVSDAGTGVTSLSYSYTGPVSGTIGSVSSGGVSWDTSTVPDGTYTVQVAIADQVGNTTPLSASVTVDNSGPVSALDGPAAGTILRGSAVALTAHASDPAGVQSVQFEVGSNGTWLPLGSSIATAGPYATSWNTTRTDDAVYQLRLAASDSLGNVSYSEPVSVVVDNTVPGAPGVPVAAANPTSAAPRLAWPASASADVAGYDVYRAGQRVATGVSGNVYSDALAADGSQDGAYAYTVSAVDQAGNESPQSAPVAVVYDRTPPTSPATLTATASADTVTLSWSAGSDPSSGNVASGLAGYVLRRSTGEPVCAVAAAVTTCGDTGRTPGATYAYVVYAVDAAGNFSRTGATASASVPKPAVHDGTPPAQPARVDAQVHGSKAELHWQNPKDRDFDHVVVVANAKHRPRSVKDGARLYSGRATSTAASGAPGTRLFVAVYAYDRAGNASRPAFVAAAFAPSALLPASGSSLSGSPQLSWRGVARATYYNVQVFLGKTRVAVGWPHGTSFRVPAGKLRKGKTYAWYVWPGFGPLKDARYGSPVGHASFTYAG